MAQLCLNMDEECFIKIDHVDVELSKSEIIFLRYKLDLLQDKVPLYSSITLNLQGRELNGETLYSGGLEIGTYNNQFHSEYESSSIEVLYHNLEKKILGQIKNWKRKRFANQEIIHIGQHKEFPTREPNAVLT